mmetsp:Transcript_53080/g.151216  ORF Transcript_53080/g.151216 Transcript_53080/m.151216 type:complete len:225 (+) Transcript_53080:1146-1820(+)
MTAALVRIAQAIITLNLLLLTILRSTCRMRSYTVRLFAFFITCVCDLVCSISFRLERLFAISHSLLSSSSRSMGVTVAEDSEPNFRPVGVSVGMGLSRKQLGRLGIENVDWPEVAQLGSDSAVFPQWNFLCFATSACFRDSVLSVPGGTFSGRGSSRVIDLIIDVGSLVQAMPTLCGSSVQDFCAWDSSMDPLSAPPSLPPAARRSLSSCRDSHVSSWRLVSIL